jgi:hypothetical protein
MKTDIEIIICNGSHHRGMYDTLVQDSIGNWYGYDYKDETVCHFDRYYKGKIHGLQYRFHNKLKEIREFTKFKYGYPHGTCIVKSYKKYGWESDMLEAVIRKNGTIVKRMDPCVVLD